MRRRVPDPQALADRQLSAAGTAALIHRAVWCYHQAQSNLIPVETITRHRDWLLGHLGFEGHGFRGQTYAMRLGGHAGTSLIAAWPYFVVPPANSDGPLLSLPMSDALVDMQHRVQQGVAKALQPVVAYLVQQEIVEPVTANGAVQVASPVRFAKLFEPGWRLPDAHVRLRGHTTALAIHAGLDWLHRQEHQLWEPLSKAHDSYPGPGWGAAKDDWQPVGLGKPFGVIQIGQPVWDDSFGMRRLLSDCYTHNSQGD